MLWFGLKIQCFGNKNLVSWIQVSSWTEAPQESWICYQERCLCLRRKRRSRLWKWWRRSKRRWLRWRRRRRRRFPWSRTPSHLLSSLTRRTPLLLEVKSIIVIIITYSNPHQPSINTAPAAEQPAPIVFGPAYNAAPATFGGKIFGAIQCIDWTG